MLIISLAGMCLGIVAGLLPGIGNGSILLLLLPFFMYINPLDILVFFISMIIGSQYVASIVSIYIGIPGAESAVSTSREYYVIRKYKLYNQAIIQNSKSSLIGNIVGIILFIPSSIFFYNLSYIYKNNVKISILFLTFLILLLTSNEKIKNIFLIILAFFLSSLGYNEQTFETFNLGLSFLDSGLSWVALMLGSLLGSSVRDLKETNINLEKNEDIKYNKMPYKRSALRGSIIGFFIGFVPGLSYILSSILTYIIEKRILKNKDIKERSLRSMSSSEAAQSSGILAMLIPFLIFGIPITASEGIILNIINISASISEVFNDLLKNIYKISFIFLFINIISYFISLNCRKLVFIIFNIPTRIISLILIFLGFLTINVSLDYNILLGILTYVLTFALFYFKRLDPICFVISILLYPQVYLTFNFYIQS